MHKKIAIGKENVIAILLAEFLCVGFEKCSASPLYRLLDIMSFTSKTITTENKNFYLVHGRELQNRLENQAINQPAIICYTSGTTSNPKGALLSQVFSFSFAVLFITYCSIKTRDGNPAKKSADSDSGF